MKLPPDHAKLEECSQEPIHRLGRVQSHGIFFAVEPEDLTIRCASANVGSYGGVELSSILGSRVGEWIDEGTLAALETAAGEGLSHPIDNPMRVTFAAGGRQWNADGILHRSGELLILELEMLTEALGNVEAFHRVTGIDAYFRLTSTTLGGIDRQTEVSQIAARMAEDVRRFTGFDRVMIYRFAEDYHGEVIGESLTGALTPFLGHHFPAGDIPPQARELYRKNWLRVIADVEDPGAELVRVGDEGDGTSIDLTYSTLRSVSPIHLQYLRNMGVRASMSVSLIDGAGELWGLIACHHHKEPLCPPYGVRAACIHYAHVMSARLSERENALRLARIASRRDRLPDLLRSVLAGSGIRQGLLQSSSKLLDVFRADGLALIEGEGIDLAGAFCPDREQLSALLKAFSSDLYQGGLAALETLDGLSLPDPIRRDLPVAGALCIRLGLKRQLILFRREYIFSLKWGGDPNEMFGDEPGMPLSPRNSFETWSETVRGRSRPWDEADLSVAKDLRSSLADVAIDRSEEIEVLNRELASKNVELQQFTFSVSHDLRSPLVTVSGYLGMLEEDLDGEQKEKVRHPLDRMGQAISKMGRLIDDLMEFSRVGKHGHAMGKVHLDPLVRTLEAAYAQRLDQRGILFSLPPAGSLPAVWGVTVDVERALQNLMDNAIKFLGDEQEEPRIWIEGGEEEGSVVVAVGDNGPGIDEAYHEKVFRLFERVDPSIEGSGVGLATVAKIMDQHGGEVRLRSRLGEGSVFELVFPAKRDLDGL